MGIVGFLSPTLTASVVMSFSLLIFINKENYWQEQSEVRKSIKSIVALGHQDIVMLLGALRMSMESEKVRHLGQIIMT